MEVQFTHDEKMHHFNVWDKRVCCDARLIVSAICFDNEQ